MQLADIYYAPTSGGKNNSGRQSMLGFSVWRRSDNRFLDAATGDWGDVCVVNPMVEQGRDHSRAVFGADQPNLRGVYLPEHPVNQGPGPLDGTYVVLFHDREMDLMVVGEEVRHYVTPPPAPAGRPTRQSTFLAGCGVLVGLLLLVGLVRR